jgi:hypothetical protein
MHDAKPSGVIYETRFPEGAEYRGSEGFLYLPGGFYFWAMGDIIHFFRLQALKGVFQ